MKQTNMKKIIDTRIMTKKQIQLNINESVNKFKEALENTFLKNKVPFYGIGIHKYFDMLRGKVSLSRKSNGNLRISGELLNQMFKPECTGLPRNIYDYNIYPLIVTLLI